MKLNFSNKEPGGFLLTGKLKHLDAKSVGGAEDKEEEAVCPRLLSQEGAGPLTGSEAAGTGAQDPTGEPGTTRITQKVSD